MAITDLTGYIWTSNTGYISAYNFPYYKSSPISINFTYNGQNYSLMFQASDTLCFGTSTSLPNYISVYDGDVNEWIATPPLVVEFTGGTGVTDATLIAWLEANGTLTAPQPTANTYTLTHTLTNVTKGNITLQLTPDTGYELPDTITVTNGTLVSYDKTTGIAVISGDDNTSVSVECVASAPVFTQVYPTRVGSWEYESDSYTRLSNMNTSKIYSVYYYADRYQSNPSVAKIQYLNGSWQISIIETDYQGSDGLTIYSQTQTSVDFYTGAHIYFYEAKPIIILEGDVAVSGVSDFSGYTATNDMATWACLSQGTQVTLADYTTKNIEDITFDDNLLVWDFYEGKLSSAKPIWIKKEEVATHYRETILEDGTVLKTVGKFHLGLGHRVYNVSKQQMIYDSESVGDNVYKQDGSVSKIVSSNVIKQDNKFYNIITEKHYNLFANGVLTSCRLSNRYGINDMKYDLSDIRMTEEEVKEYLDKLD